MNFVKYIPNINHDSDINRDTNVEFDKYILR